MSAETPAGGTDGIGYAVRGVRSTPCPVMIRPSSSNSTGGGSLASEDRDDIGHSTLVTKRPSEGHADKKEKLSRHTAVQITPIWYEGRPAERRTEGSCPAVSRPSRRSRSAGPGR